MAIGLIVISFLALMLAVWQADPKGEGLRSAFLKSAVIHGAAIALLSEGLSASHLLTAQAVILAWTLLALIHCSILAFLVRQGRIICSLAPLQALWQRLQSQAPWNRVLLAGITSILLVCLVTALIAPPNNWDSMTYHMPRVMHWIQNRSLNHYPTHNLRQISFSGGASYIVLHLQFLAGSDRVANCVQWVAFLGCILGTSLLTRVLGNPATQILTAALCASVLMAVMQATTTQNDLVVSFWLVCCAYFIVRTEQYRPVALLWIAAAWGLAVLTKPTAYLFGAPLLALLGLRLLRSARPTSTWLQAGVRSTGLTVGVAILGLGLSLPGYGRNLATFGSFLGIDTDTRNAVVSPIGLVANLFRNIAVLIPFPPVFALAQGLLQGLGMDPNDPATTFTATPFDLSSLNWVNLFMPDEDAVASPIHASLTLLGLLLLLGNALVGRRRSALWQLAATTLLGFLLFSLLLRWQVWHNRLLLPFLILGTPLASQALSQGLPKRLPAMVASLVISIALAYSLVPIHHPLIGLPERWTNRTQAPSILSTSREQLLFSTYIKNLREPYTRFVDDLIERDRCYRLGLSIGSDDWEYPFWVLIQARTTEPFKIRHDNVDNVSRTLPLEFPNEQLCGVFEKRELELRYYKRTPAAPASL